MFIYLLLSINIANIWARQGTHVEVREQLRELLLTF